MLCGGLAYLPPLARVSPPMHNSHVLNTEFSKFGAEEYSLGGVGVGVVRACVHVFVHKALLGKTQVRGPSCAAITGSCSHHGRSPELL